MKPTINIITLFPDFFDSPLQMGILGRALQNRLLSIRFINPRDFALGQHKKVDDSPFGGGDGMVMQYYPLKKAYAFALNLPTSVKGGAFKVLPSNSKANLKHENQNKISIKNKQSQVREKLIYLSPQGRLWNHKLAKAWAGEKNTVWTFLCGRYAGVDQRFVSEFVTEEISLGDYVLTGGEPAMLLILDSMVRYLKGALGNQVSIKEESFEQDNLLESPQWTRPRDIKGQKIPEVILSGHHKDIKHFRYLMSLLITALKKPRLLTPQHTKNLAKALEMATNLSELELKACGLSSKS